MPALSSPPSAAPVRPRLLTVLCNGAMMCLAIGLNLLPVFLTTLDRLFGGTAGLSHEELGRLGALAFGGLVTGILVTGPLADRWGAKPFAQLGNALIALSLLALASAPNYASLGAGLFCLGFGAGVLDMVLSPIVAALNPVRRAAAMNWLHSFYSIGAAVTIFTGTIVLKAGFGWRTACLSLLPLPLALLVAFAPLRFPALVAESGRTPLRALARQRWFVLALLAIFLGGATEAGLAQWLPAYAEISLGYPAWIGGGALFLFSMAMALGRMLVGAAGARADPFQIMAFGCAATVALFLAGAFSTAPGIALAACIAAGFAGGCLWPTMLAVTADRHPDGGASMFGALAALGNAGGIVMPWMVGWIADEHSLRAGIAFSAIAPAAMLALVAALRRTR